MVPNLSEKDEDALRTILGYCNNAEIHIKDFGDSYDDFCNNLAYQESCSFDAIQIGEPDHTMKMAIIRNVYFYDCV